MTTTARSVDDARRVALARALGYAPTLGWEQLIDGVKDRLEAAERRRAQAEVIHVNARRQIAALTRCAEDAEAALERARALHGVTVDSPLTAGTEEAGQ